MKTRTSLSLASAVAAVVIGLVLWLAPAPDSEPVSVIVQAADLETARDAVLEAGGEVTHELRVIHGVGAIVTSNQRNRLRARPGVRVFDDQEVAVAKKPDKTPDLGTVYPTLVGAQLLHSEGITGRNVTVAVLDTGWDNFGAVSLDTAGEWRVYDSYDAIQDVIVGLPWRGPVYYPSSWGENDSNGHASHVMSIALSSGNTNFEAPQDGLYNGIAPDAGLVVVKAFDASGQGTYSDVIRGIDWVVQNQPTYDIRVLNCSFSAPARSHYWEDPLNQAIMAAWRAGIVVVASAGNSGPDPMTIGVPGNNPYVITVGAMSDSYTPTDPDDDYLTSFSSVGPTHEGFIKPEVVAPGGHMIGLIPYNSTLQVEHPEFFNEDDEFTMSGTSQAAAVVSGAAALMLDADPTLTPDDVKCRLLATASPATDASGDLAYSIFQQGAGLISVYDAVYSTAVGCANLGLDVDRDVLGLEHFSGRARQTQDGTFYVDGVDGLEWDGSYSWTEAFIWNDAFVWNDAYIWNDAFMWNDAFIWNDAYVWNDALTEPMAINVWVPQE